MKKEEIDSVSSSNLKRISYILKNVRQRNNFVTKSLLAKRKKRMLQLVSSQLGL